MVSGESLKALSTHPKVILAIVPKLSFDYAKISHSRIRQQGKFLYAKAESVGSVIPREFGLRRIRLGSKLQDSI